MPFLDGATSNQVEKPARPTTLVNYFISSYTIIDEADIPVHNEEIGLMNVDEERELSHTILIPGELEAGDYSLIIGVNLDTIWVESDFTNNFVFIGLEVLPEIPDMEIVVSTDTLRASTGDTLTVLSTITNTGNGRSESLILEYILSVDAIEDESDLILEQVSINSLDPEMNIGQQDQLMIPEYIREGDYTLILKVYEFGTCIYINSCISIHVLYEFYVY